MPAFRTIDGEFISTERIADGVFADDSLQNHAVTRTHYRDDRPGEVDRHDAVLDGIEQQPEVQRSCMLHGMEPPCRV